MTKTPTKTGPQTWPELMVAGWILGAEMSAVIWLHSLRMMTGGAVAQREAQRAVSEKLSAGMTLLPAIMAGGANQSAEQVAARAIAHYRAPVRANRKRLSR